MADAPDSEYTYTERIALLVWWLAEGERLTTEQVVQRFHIRRGEAAKMFTRISRKLPIYREDGGVWQKVDETRG